MNLPLFRVCLPVLALLAAPFLQATTPVMPGTPGTPAPIPTLPGVRPIAPGDDPRPPRFLSYCPTCGRPWTGPRIPVPRPDPVDPLVERSNIINLTAPHSAAVPDDIFMDVFMIVTSRGNVSTDDAIKSATIIADGYRNWYKTVLVPNAQRTLLTESANSGDKQDYKDCYMMVAKVGLDRGDPPDKIKADADKICSHMVTRMNGGNGN